jgi:hypothetical protein
MLMIVILMLEVWLDLFMNDSPDCDNWGWD